MKLYRLGVCLKCRGDLAYDEGDWLCLQCGVYYYTGLYPEGQSGASGGGGLLRIACAGVPEYGDAGELLAPAAN